MSPEYLVRAACNTMDIHMTHREKTSEAYPMTRMVLSVVKVILLNKKRGEPEEELAEITT